MTQPFDHEFLFLPGPVEVRREILDAQGTWMIGHRGKAFEQLYASLQPKLLESFGAGEGYRVYVYTSSGTGIWESASRCAVRDDQAILHCVNGAFSERWAEVSQANGKQVDVVEAEWGRVIKPEQVAEALKQKRYDAVALVYNETSCGLLNPLPEIAEVVRQYDDTLLLVDAVSGWTGVEVEAAAWGVDVVLASSQKALALPPGIAFGAVSDRVLARAGEIPHRGYYFDMLELEKHHLKNNTPATPPISLMFAADVQFDSIRAEGYANRFARHRQMAARVKTWAESHGLTMFPEAGYESPTVSAICMNGRFEFKALQGFLKERHISLGGGYGKIKGETFRIGHMGEVHPEQLEILLSAIDDFLAGQ